MKKLILFCAILMAVGTLQNLSAQLPQRVVVIEEYTSATCVPCLIADSMLKPIVKISNGVIAVRYHQPIPFKGDPFYVANVSENKGRNDYYAVGSAMPAARLNGNINVDPTDGSKVLEAAKISQSQAWPVRMSVVQDKTDKDNIKVQVTISTDVALENYTLQTIVTVHDLVLDKLPLLPQDYTESLEHWNGSKEFADAMLKMLPDINGTQVSIPAGGSKTFDLTYKALAGDLWKFDQLQVVAFLQNNITTEIIQGATTLTGTMGSLISTTIAYPPSIGPIFAAKSANEFVETNIRVANVGTKAVAYEGFTVVKSARTPADWALTVSDPATTFTIDPGKSRDVTVRLTRGTSIGTGEVLFSFKESGAGGRSLNGIPITISAKEAEGFLVVDNLTQKSEPYSSAIQSRVGGKKYVEITPLNIMRHSNLFPNMRNIIWNCSDSGAVDVKEYAFITTMMNKGISSIISGQFITNFANFNGGLPMFDMFGVSYNGKVIRDQVFKVAGVAGDTISNGINDSCSIKSNYAFYTLAMKKPLKAGVTPFLRHASATNDSVGGVRYEAPTARMIYFSMNPAIIQNASVRNSLINRSLAWIENYVPAPYGKLTTPRDTIDLGIVTSAPLDKIVPIAFSNIGNALFEVGSVTLKGQDPLDFTMNNSLVGRPFYAKITDTTAFEITFAPKAALTNKTYSVILELTSNRPTDDKLAVTLILRGQPTGVDEGTLSTTSLSAQPNPANEALTVTYTTQSNAQGVLMLNDVLGREVLRMATGEQPAGTHSSVFETSGLPTGAYTLVFASGNQRSQIPVMIVR
ncbi:MAG: T9SS type A sorting domain-containing protein [Ignavibacteria bacterium]|nr:T9SS type A sorting domain-containing protein [Ignavibacteria bacterium]